MRSEDVQLVEVDGKVLADAPWLAEPVEGANAREAFERAYFAPRTTEP